MKSLSFFILFFILISCEKDKENDSSTFQLPGVWVTTEYIFPTDIDFLADPVSFCINNAYYIGLGCNIAIVPDIHNGLYKFTPTRGWDVMSSFPGKERMGAIVFTLNGKAFVGLGRASAPFSSEQDILDDLWRYDPENNTWDSLPYSFPLKGREDAISFVCDGKAYVGTGYDGDLLGDFYTFSEEKGWELVPDMYLNVRRGATVLQLNQQIYVTMGLRCYSVDRFSAPEKKWEKMQSLNPIDYPDFVRVRGIPFVLNENGEDIGYIVGGYNPGQQLNVWCCRYTPHEDRWYKVDHIPPYKQFFTIDNVLYAVRGLNTFKLKY